MPLSITKPTVGGSSNTWGTEVNAALDAIKSFVDTLETGLGKYVGVNAQTGTTYTPVLADAGKLVTLSNAAAITVTLPSDATVALAIGTVIDFAGIGVGLVTFSAGSGATRNPSPAATRAQYSVASAIKTAANTWLVVGDLA